MDFINDKDYCMSKVYDFDRQETAARTTRHLLLMCRYIYWDIFLDKDCLLVDQNAVFDYLNNGRVPIISDEKWALITLRRSTSTLPTDPNPEHVLEDRRREAEINENRMLSNKKGRKQTTFTYSDIKAESTITNAANTFRQFIACVERLGVNDLFMASFIENYKEVETLRANLHIKEQSQNSLFKMLTTPTLWSHETKQQLLNINLVFYYASQHASSYTELMAGGWKYIYNRLTIRYISTSESELERTPLALSKQTYSFSAMAGHHKNARLAVDGKASLVRNSFAKVSTDGRNFLDMCKYMLTSPSSSRRGITTRAVALLFFLCASCTLRVTEGMQLSEASIRKLFRGEKVMQRNGKKIRAEAISMYLVILNDDQFKAVYGRDIPTIKNMTIVEYMHNVILPEVQDSIDYSEPPVPFSNQRVLMPGDEYMQRLFRKHGTTYSRAFKRFRTGIWSVWRLTDTPNTGRFNGQVENQRGVGISSFSRRIGLAISKDSSKQLGLSMEHINQLAQNDMRHGSLHTTKIYSAAPDIFKMAEREHGPFTVVDGDGPTEILYTKGRS